MICKSCGEPEADFYASNQTTCKECLKSKARANRKNKIDYYRSYDRLRYRESDERKAAAAKCAKSPAGIEARKRSQARLKETQPEKYRARNAVSNAIRDGRLKRAETCYFCSAAGKLQAHHQDYSRPLDVFWLCAACHGKLHAVNGDFLRGQEAG